MKHRLLWLFLSLILLTFFGCKQKFSKVGWNDGDGVFYANRDAMLDDLLETHPLKGLTYHQLVNLLGEPMKNDSLKVFYEIKVKYDVIDPVYSKDLICSLNKDSIITKVEIKEWKKH
jgi:hypothetical protein